MNKSNLKIIEDTFFIFLLISPVFLINIVAYIIFNDLFFIFVLLIQVLILIFVLLFLKYNELLNR